MAVMRNLNMRDVLSDVAGNAEHQNTAVITEEPPLAYWTRCGR
jgi:hypothetical protein